MTTNIRVAVVGDGGVGKSTLAIRFIQNEFIEEYDPTIEDIYSKEIDWNDSKIKFLVFDSAPQDEFYSYRYYSLRNQEVFLLVYSVTQKNTLNMIRDLYDRITDYVSDQNKDPFFILVGNKIDLFTKRQVPTHQAKAFADELDFGFIEISAKTGQNVNQLFFQIANAFCNRKSYIDSLQAKKKKKNCILM
ncbi:ras di-ras and rheb family members of small gtpase superfamily [Anaeramoeba ignava]|uniref:Ras di-ras and rheb family members of small gtpase superfamily n=1 Tax=Anaeramoeba ignava TaxID=1746090 RepID=A0A9Q0R7B9_ANAIG|nr:ras di-ras and rheb family members of small gtpase superfamily [Anaeramoeba ignava]